MLVPVDTLIAGVVHTLKTHVLPEVGTGFARGQLFAVIDVLQNLENRVEEKAELHAMEADSAAAALARVVAVLRAGGQPAAAAAVAGDLAAVPAEPPHARTAAVRAAVLRALERLGDLPAPVADAARTALGEYLGVQATRDVALLKPSLLNAISKG